MTEVFETTRVETFERSGFVRGTSRLKAFLMGAAGLLLFAAASGPGGAMAQDQEKPPLNAANLPPIESIGPESDIRPFLTPGVPADLTRAALSRAWSTDPAIRDFIGLSENSWDFNAQDGAPGFGSPTRQLSARMTGKAERSDTERLVPIPIVEAVQAPSSAPLK